MIYRTIVVDALEDDERRQDKRERKNESERGRELGGVTETERVGGKRRRASERKAKQRNG